MATVSAAPQAAYHLPTFLADVADLLRRRGVAVEGPVDPGDTAQKHARGLLRALGVKPGRLRSPRPRRSDPIPAELFETPVMRAAFARRDIATVVKRLQSSGISQRRIGAWTGQSQSEISEILNGRRIMSVGVLDGIAAGFGVPPSWLGLGYDRETQELLDAANEVDQNKRCRR
jgi:hypothetical protein